MALLKRAFRKPPRPRRSQMQLIDRSTLTEFGFTEFDDGVVVMTPASPPDRYGGPPPLTGIYPSFYAAEQGRQEAIRHWMHPPAPEIAEEVDPIFGVALVKSIFFGWPE